MKTNKKTWILLGVVAALVVFLIFKPEASIKNVVKWKALKKDADKILIEKGSRSISLVKKGNDWLLGTNAWLADNEKIKKLAETLKSARRFEVVDTHNLDDKYEIDASNRTTATLHTSAGDRTLIIGKTAPTYSHTFVKIPKDSKTYQTEGSFSYDFNQEASYFRAKQIFNFSSDEAKSLELRDASGRSLTLTKTPEGVPSTNAPAKTVWRDGQGRVYNDQEIGDLSSMISHLSASGFPEDGKFTFEAIAKTPILSQIVVKTAAKNYSLTIFKSKIEKDSLAISSERKEVFLLAEDMVKRLSPDFAKLLK